MRERCEERGILRAITRREAEMSNVAERRQAGKALRKKIPRSSHADWSPPANRPNPVDTVTSQNESRLPWLVPVRHGRMSESAFAFYRGGAKVMAADLATSPVTGLTVQACGDAHLSNFGLYGSPERQLLFDVNDFDEAYITLGNGEEYTWTTGWIYVNGASLAKKHQVK